MSSPRAGAGGFGAIADAVRVVFLGNAAWSVPSLEALAGSAHSVSLVVTRVPRPAGRGGDSRPTPVGVAARDAMLPLAEVETVRAGAGLEALERARPDALAVVAYGEILPTRVLAAARVAPVNVHFSLLPELRGAAPVQRAIMNGLTATGVTTIRMDAGMDTGPMLLQAVEPIEPDDDAGSLGRRLAAVGGRLLVDTLDRLETGAIDERPQDEARASYAPKLTRDDERLDWSETADAIARRVRALAPAPGAFTTFRGRTLKVFAARASQGPAPGTGEPGGVVTVPDDRFVVRAGAGVVELVEVALEGRRRMTGGEFIRGHRPRTDEVLG